MDRLGKFISRIQSGLLKLYLRYQGLELKDIRQIRFHDNRTKEVFVIKGRYFLDAQNLILLNTILAKEDLFDDYSENVQKFILEHEYAHGKHYLVNALLLVPLFIGFIGFFSGFLGTLTYIFFCLILIPASGPVHLIR